VRNEFAPSRSPIPGRIARPAAVQIAARIRARESVSLSLSVWFTLSRAGARDAIDSAPVSGKRLHSLDQYLQRDSEFRLHAPSDLARVSRDSWPTSGDIHKARTLSGHPETRRVAFMVPMCFMGSLMRDRPLSRQRLAVYIFWFLCKYIPAR